MRGAVRLPEDMYKVKEARNLADKAKKDPLSYQTPQACINDLHGEFKRGSEVGTKAIDPDTVAELMDKRDMGYGVTTYLVQDDQEGQCAMRKIIDTHWGKDANPWCLLHGDGKGNLSDGTDGGYDARYYWNHYSALPKRVAFKDGKLLAFMATAEKNYSDDDSLWDEYDDYVRAEEEFGSSPRSFEDWLIDNKHSENIPEQWWDRQDASHEGIPLGSIPVPNDKFGRWADFEIREGKLQRLGGYHKGKPNQNGRIEWYANGNIAQKIDGNLLLNWNENGGLEMYREKDADGAIIKVFDYDENGDPFFGSEGGIYTDFTEDGEFVKEMRMEAERIYRENSQKPHTPHDIAQLKDYLKHG